MKCDFGVVWDGYGDDGVVYGKERLMNHIKGGSDVHLL